MWPDVTLENRMASGSQVLGKPKNWLALAFV
jgi:hypothetical protein